MGSILYNIIIQPLVLLYDVCYTILYRMIDDPVLAILALSIIINCLALPLYRKADLMQKSEMEQSKKMKPWLDHIRAHFSGDERFMMTQAYYKVEHYNPLSVIKEAGPLALQIPFFMAAYNYISQIPLLETATFWSINNLLAPDGLLQVGNITINFLPIIMTAINCLSGFIYTKGAPLRQKIQVYGIAAVFLVLLYNSASGLVIYWIMNQIFSLGKNIFFTLELKGKDKTSLGSMVAIALLLLIEFGMFNGNITSGIELFVAECVVIICIIRLVSAIILIKELPLPPYMLKIGEFWNSNKNKKSIPLMALIEVCLALLLGVYIPSSVLSASPKDFIDKASGAFPYDLLSYPALLYGGLLILWMSVIILAQSEKKRKNLTLLLWIVLGVSLVNHFFFDPKVGLLYANLVFYGTIQAGVLRSIINVAVCIVLAVLFMFMFIRKPQWVVRASSIIAVVMLVMSLNNILTIHRTVKSSEVADDVIEITSEGNHKDPKVIRLSPKGNNVIVFMLDRAIGAYVPLIFDEMPELKEKFEGFTYYEDTLSFGLCTNYGVPPLFGGYEYTPAEMNKRGNELLKDKHNEAILLMPRLFAENGYHATVCDIPYANYKNPSDLSIYDSYSDIETYMLTGRYTSAFQSIIGETEVNQKRNFLMYSIFRVVPLPVKGLVYDGGNYISIVEEKATYTKEFLNNYSTLDALPKITEVKNNDDNYFLMMQNATPHEPVALNSPEYQVDGETVKSNALEVKTVEGRTIRIGESETSPYSYNGMILSRENIDWMSYCANAATFRVIGNWLDYLRENDVYDNTRIIFAADHGYPHGQIKELCRNDGLDVEAFWPLLMMKDFDAHGSLVTSSEFMTQADVPTLAMEGIISEPINPFTGNLINNDAKRGNLFVTDSWKWDVASNNGTIFDTEGNNWWTVHDSIFDLDNWVKVDDWK